MGGPKTGVRSKHLMELPEKIVSQRYDTFVLRKGHGETPECMK
jgi:hypothetical protein